MSFLSQNTKVTGPDKIVVDVLKYIHPELSKILAQLLKEESLPSLRKVLNVYPVFKNGLERLFMFHLSAFTVSLANF